MKAKAMVEKIDKDKAEETGIESPMEEWDIELVAHLGKIALLSSCLCGALKACPEELRVAMMETLVETKNNVDRRFPTIGSPEIMFGHCPICLSERDPDEPRDTTPCPHTREMQAALLLVAIFQIQPKPTGVPTQEGMPEAV